MRSQANHVVAVAFQVRTYRPNGIVLKLVGTRNKMAFLSFDYQTSTQSVLNIKKGTKKSEGCFPKEFWKVIGVVFCKIWLGQIPIPPTCSTGLLRLLHSRSTQGNFYERKWAVIFEVILLPLLRMKLRRGLFSNSTFLSCSVLYVCMVLWEAGLSRYWRLPALCGAAHMVAALPVRRSSARPIPVP